MTIEELLGELRHYIRIHSRPKFAETYGLVAGAVCHTKELAEHDLILAIGPYLETKRSLSFRDTLMELIDKKKSYDHVIYKKAGLDRRHFHKIKSDPSYKVGKSTAIALALALELDIDDAGRLIGSAGYLLSTGIEYDLLVRFCFEYRIYDIYEVNGLLYHFDLRPIACAV